jgi:hypothetical protein
MFIWGAAGEPDAIGFLCLPEWRFHKLIGELTSSGLICRQREDRCQYSGAFCDAAQDMSQIGCERG